MSLRINDTAPDFTADTTQGLGHRELCAFSIGAGNRHRASVQLGQLLRQLQADAGAFERSPARPFNPMKSLEDSRQFVLCNSSSRVSDRKLNVVVQLLKSNPDFALECELKGILKAGSGRSFPTWRWVLPFPDALELGHQG